MIEHCPYCEQSFADPCDLYRHAMTEHRLGVLSYWIEQHDVTPGVTGQQRLQEAVL